MKLYLFPPAPFSRKVLLAAYERGIALDQIVVTPFDPEAKKAFRSIYPIVTLPLLVTDAGVCMPESSIIMEYLDLITLGEQLLPRDPVQALPLRAFDRQGDLLLGATQYLAFAMRKPAELQNTSRIETNLRTVRETLSMLDASLAGKSFLMEERLTFADIGPICAIASLISDGSIHGVEPWPEVHRWLERVTERPSWMRILEESKVCALPPGFAARPK